MGRAVWEPGQAGGRLQDVTTLQAVGKAARRTMDGVGPGKQSPGLRRAHGAWAVWARREDPAQAQQTGGPVPHARWHACSLGMRGASRVPSDECRTWAPGGQEAPLQVDQDRASWGKGGRQTPPRQGMEVSSVGCLQQQRPAACLYSSFARLTKRGKNQPAPVPWEPQLRLELHPQFQVLP